MNKVPCPGTIGRRRGRAGRAGVSARARRWAAAPPVGAEEKPDQEASALMKEVGGKANGTIVWSSSRLGNHDLFVMKTDGSNVHPITHGEPVDWFPRFSPDGSRILFTRSKKGWVFERDANTDGKWDIYTVTPDGTDETKVVDNASWGSWVSNDEIVFARVDGHRSPQAGRRRGDACSSTAPRCRSSTARCCSSPRCRTTAGTSPSRCAGRSARRASGTSARRPGRAPATAARSTGTRRGARSTGCIPPATAAAACCRCRSRTARRPKPTPTSTRSR